MIHSLESLPHTTPTRVPAHTSLYPLGLAITISILLVGCVFNVWIMLLGLILCLAVILGWNLERR